MRRAMLSSVNLDLHSAKSRDDCLLETPGSLIIDDRGDFHRELEVLDDIAGQWNCPCSSFVVEGHWLKPFRTSGVMKRASRAS
jgi:hypothetical protein